jgi:hypothetical protein
MQANDSKSIIWHTSYDVKNPPARPSERHVRFVVISDTHGTQPDVPDGVSCKGILDSRTIELTYRSKDVLLHSGDLSEIGGVESIISQFEWLEWV